MSKKKSITKEIAIERLFAAGYLEEADALKSYRSVENTNKGWDGWLRNYYPQVVDIVWRNSSEGHTGGVLGI